MFKGLGILLIIYVLYGIYCGRVYAKEGPGGRMFHRTEEPGRYWIIISVYILLATALIFIF